MFSLFHVCLGTSRAMSYPSWHQNQSWFSRWNEMFKLSVLGQTGSSVYYRDDRAVIPLKYTEADGFWIVASLELRLDAITGCWIVPGIFKVRYTWILRHHSITTSVDYYTNWIFVLIAWFYTKLFHVLIPLDCIGLHPDSGIFSLYVIFPGLTLEVSQYWLVC